MKRGKTSKRKKREALEVIKEARSGKPGQKKIGQMSVEKRSPADKQGGSGRPSVPDLRVMEGAMFDMFDVSEQTPLRRAQELMYDAWEIDSPGKRVKLALKALQISPDCADAYVVLAEEAPTVAEAIRMYRKGAEAGEKAVGERAFREDVGRFWLILDTRPYMRARAGLAQSLWTAGRREEAVAHYRDMLRLNPGDNQGIRYVLAACLLDMGRDEELASLLDSYGKEKTAAWVYSRAILAFRRTGNSEESHRALAGAIRQNPHVPAYLLGRRKLPKILPDCVGRGDESEAICYAGDNISGWKKTPGALEWLASYAK